MEDKKISFLTKFVCVYIIDIICGIIEGGIRLNLFEHLFSMIGGISCAMLFTHLVQNIIAAGVWHLLEKAEGKYNLIYRVRNIFLGLFYSGVSTFLVYVAKSGKSYFESMEDVVVFYSVIVFEAIIIALLIPYFDKLFNNKSFLNSLLKGLKICFNIFLYWSLIVIVLSWMPFGFNYFILKLITYPVLAICAPVTYFVGNQLDVVTTVLVMYIIKIFIENEIKNILETIEKNTDEELPS